MKKNGPPPDAPARRAGRGPKVLRGTALLLAFLVLAGSTYFLYTLESGICAVCQRPLHGASTYRIVLSGGDDLDVCCPRCGLHYQELNGQRVKEAWIGERPPQESSSPPSRPSTSKTARSANAARWNGPGRMDPATSTLWPGTGACPAWSRSRTAGAPWTSNAAAAAPSEVTRNCWRRGTGNAESAREHTSPRQKSSRHSTESASCADCVATRSHMVEYAPSSRLVRRAQPRSRCYAGLSPRTVNQGEPWKEDDFWGLRRHRCRPDSGPEKLPPCPLRPGSPPGASPCVWERSPTTWAGIGSGDAHPQLHRNGFEGGRAAQHPRPWRRDRHFSREAPGGDDAISGFTGPSGSAWAAPASITHPIRKSCAATSKRPRPLSGWPTTSEPRRQGAPQRSSRGGPGGEDPWNRSDWP